MAHLEKVGFKAFLERFSNGKACREYLFNLRRPQGFVCPKRGSIGEYSVKIAGKDINAQSVDTKTSVTAGTIVDHTHRPLQIWFWPFDQP